MSLRANSEMLILVTACDQRALSSSSPRLNSTATRLLKATRSLRGRCGRQPRHPRDWPRAFSYRGNVWTRQRREDSESTDSACIP